MECKAERFFDDTGYILYRIDECLEPRYTKNDVCVHIRTEISFLLLFLIVFDDTKRKIRVLSNDLKHELLCLLICWLVRMSSIQFALSSTYLVNSSI